MDAVDAVPPTKEKPDTPSSNDASTNLVESLTMAEPVETHIQTLTELNQPVRLTRAELLHIVHLSAAYGIEKNGVCIRKYYSTELLSGIG